jgi:hypothetical protein
MVGTVVLVIPPVRIPQHPLPSREPAARNLKRSQSWSGFPLVCGAQKALQSRSVPDTSARTLITVARRVERLEMNKRDIRLADMNKAPTKRSNIEALVYLAPFGEDAGHFSLYPPCAVRKLSGVSNLRQIFQFLYVLWPA